MGIKDDFAEMGIYQYGFEKPSAIQQHAVVPILQGRDVIAQAQSGTGKTSMIGLTVCQTVDTSSRECVLLNLFSLFLSVLLQLLPFFYLNRQGQISHYYIINICIYLAYIFMTLCLVYIILILVYMDRGSVI